MESLYAQATQKDSIGSIPEVTVYGNRLEEYKAGVKIIASDSITKNNFRHSTLCSFLDQNSSVYIKSYGLGSLATTSFRGASASQTSVLWNGFNLQSPMNGTLDLSLVPLSLVDQVNVQHGGFGALWGSGSVSGSIHLENKPFYGKGWSLKYESNYGSFKTHSQLASIGLSRKKWIVSVKGFLTQAKNDFLYTNIAQYGEPKQHQTNAALQQYGYMLDNYLKLSSKNQLNFRIWQQYSNREIPPTMLTDISDALQKDWFIRISSEFQHSRKKAVYNIRLAYFDENLFYQEKSKGLNAYSRSMNQISELETKISIIKRGVLNIGINNTYSVAEVASYQGIPYQNRSALFSSLKYSNKKNNWKMNLGARKEWIVGSLYSRGQEVPIMPFAGTDFLFTKKLVLKANVSRNYRLPTFNDLYWIPGGNINLKPEQGWSEEAGLHFTHQNKECNGDDCANAAGLLAAFNMSSTFFNRNIDNWIMWIPQGSYWAPMNVLKVWSRGIENSIDLNVNLRPVLVKLGARYDYVLSTTEQVAPGNENELHKQLIYVPPHKAAFKAGIVIKGYGLNYTHHYTSWVFTQADNKNFIDPYGVGNLVFSKTYSLGKKGGGINFLMKINNVWDNHYQVISYRAMPGRNYEAGISIQYNQK